MVVWLEGGRGNETAHLDCIPRSVPACGVIPGKALELRLPQLPHLEIQCSFLRNFLYLGLEVQQMISFTHFFY